MMLGLCVGMALAIPQSMNSITLRMNGRIWRVRTFRTAAWLARYLETLR